MNYNIIGLVKEFNLSISEPSTARVEIKTQTNQPYYLLRGVREGEGYIAVVLKGWDGVGYKIYIREDTFQAELDNYLENPPTEDSADTAPSSEWAFDHDANAAAHHAKYTDAESVGAFYSRAGEITTGVYTAEDVTDLSYIYLNTAGGDITLKGLDGGVIGQIIFFIKNYDGNDVHIIHNSGDAASGDKIFTAGGGDESLSAGNRGVFMLIYHGGTWQVSRPLT